MKARTLAFVALTLAAGTIIPGAGSARDRWIGERNRETIFGRIVDGHGRPLRARVELWYADISKPITTELSESVPKDEQFQRTLFHSDFSNDKGWYNVDAIDGEWLVRVHKGPEWEIKEFKVKVEGGELDGQRHDVVLERLWDLNKEGWWSGDMHHHSIHSDGRQSPGEVAEAMLAVDVDFAALTDHNNLEQRFEWANFVSDEFLPFPAVEVTTTSPAEMSALGKGFSHMNAIDVEDLPNPANRGGVIFNRYLYRSAADVQRAIDMTHRMGGLYLLTHSTWPVDWPAGTMSSWGEIKNYDAIDVFVGWDVGPHLPTTMASDYGESIFGTAQFNLNTVATQAWFEMLNAGNKVAGWASSDCHDTQSMKHTGAGAPIYWRNVSGNARVYVHTGRDHMRKDEIKDALKSGRAFVTSGYFGPLLLASSGRALPGDVLKPRRRGGPSQVPLALKILYNRPIKGLDDGIRIIVGGKVVKTLPTHEWEGERVIRTETAVEVPRGKDSWIVVETFGEWPSMAMTNAFYVDGDGDGEFGQGKRGPREWKFPPNAKQWFNPFAIQDEAGNFVRLNIPEITVPDASPRSPIPVAEVDLGNYRVFR
jgi:hypothetical protein